MYSFGGFNTLRVQRELNHLSGKRLVKDSFAYPGGGFMNNLFFIRDSLMYIGGGLDSGVSHYFYNDFWQYNMAAHSWKRLNNLPFYYRFPLSVFTEGTKQIVLVPKLQGDSLEEAGPVCYAYDPAADNWQMISKELPPSKLFHTTDRRIPYRSLRITAFRIGDNIYALFQSVCRMEDDCSNNFFKFNLPAREWTELPSFPGKANKMLFAAFSFSDGVYGYVGGGFGRNSGNSKEVYRYDPEREKWEQIRSLPHGVRYAKGWRYKNESYVGFGINDKDLTVMVWKIRMKQ